ncbi:hypothetical protein ALI144C_37655 [Actinosynnema sp. ALI-1.44]|uniref:50S ribosomal protein L11 methyltransferase n=1 Tax=Actinosynnema sp. ALI-1.44 TaxID=1933779 RepID=UPI00097BB035|nr:class I SAM-dependent methyltransferase [Actinosynnema sp. ALI-1.44]ONI76375.1 hypothetical protein ALI144C_37655 [Actinosynnema sp. ALI-1.44]
MDPQSVLMHQAMLADRPRMRAYDRALEQAVGPGDVVVDVGAGALALSMLALRHGAGHVYAVEADPDLVAVAEAIVRDNDLKGRITVVQADARVVRLPRKADVVVAELIGNLGPEEDMMGAVGSVARRWLVPGGRVVPRGLATRLAAIEFDQEGWGLWGDDFLGYRMSAVQQLVAPAAQLHFFQRHPRLLSEPVLAEGLRPGGPPWSGRLRIAEPGTLHAVIGYFTVDLADGVTLTNFPSYPGCNWAVWVWPVRHTGVAVDTELSVRLHSPRGRRQGRVATDWWLECGLVGRGAD